MAAASLCSALISMQALVVAADGAPTVYYSRSPEVVVNNLLLFCCIFSVKLQTDGKNEEAATQRTVGASSQDSLASRLTPLWLVC